MAGPWFLVACALSVLPSALACTLAPQEHAPAGASPPPFLSAERCALCHSASPRAQALRNAAGEDVSPHGTWAFGAMANAFADPYWRAQMAYEVESAPERAEEIEALCLTCHAPVAHHAARLAGTPPPDLGAASADPVAREGVTCTVCHRATAEGLGTPASFSGNLDIRSDTRIYGPYEAPRAGPMRMHTGFTPTHGPHVSSSALCGACHTLYTRPSEDAEPFLEQASYLEWRNSAYSDEAGPSADARTCQACHMSDEGTLRIARNPGGRDFNLAPRPNVRSHAFNGANTLLPALLERDALARGDEHSAAGFRKAAEHARTYLAEAAARLELTRVERSGDRLEFDLRVENLAGHKLPSGYPSRRVWLAVEVSRGGEQVFASGLLDATGRIAGVADELALPHFDRIERSDQAQVYERVATDLRGRTTTNLVEMARTSKDTRLLPRGWRADGPHAVETAPVGTEHDDDFGDGTDTVTYVVALPPGGGPATLEARLLYQPVPPAWAEGLAASRTQEVARFLAEYRALAPRPEVLARCSAILENDAR